MLDRLARHHLLRTPRQFENYVASVGGVTVGGVVHPRAEACPAFEKTEGFHLGAKGELNHHWLAGATVGDCEIACCAQQWCISFDYSASEQIFYLSWNSHLDHDLVAAEDGSDWAYYFRSGAEGRFANFPIDPPRAESCGAYRVYPGKAVAGHNVEHHWGVSVADCEALCCRYTWCVSFDYAIEHHECYLQDFGRSSNDFESNEAYDFYGVASRARRTPTRGRPADVVGDGVRQLVRPRLTWRSRTRTTSGSAT